MSQLKIVAHVPSKPIEFGGAPHDGWLPSHVASPLATPIKTVNLKFEIVDDGDGYLLIFQPCGQPHDVSLANDYWHESQAEAELQAFRMFGIEPDEWVRL